MYPRAHTYDLTLAFSSIHARHRPLTPPHPTLPMQETTVHHYSGSNSDLGTACGKYFRVGVCSIINPGDSDITQPAVLNALV